MFPSCKHLKQLRQYIIPHYNFMNLLYQTYSPVNKLAVTYLNTYRYPDPPLTAGVCQSDSKGIVLKSRLIRCSRKLFTDWVSMRTHWSHKYGMTRHTHMMLVIPAITELTLGQWDFSSFIPECFGVCPFLVSMACHVVAYTSWLKFTRCRKWCFLFAWLYNYIMC